MKDRFSTKSESMKSVTAFLLMASASIRFLAMPGLAGTPKDKKYTSLSSKLELKGLVVALLIFSSWCLVMVERLFLAVPWGCLRFVIVVFPDHTHLLFLVKPETASSTRSTLHLSRLSI